MLGVGRGFAPKKGEDELDWTTRHRRLSDGIGSGVRKAAVVKCYSQVESTLIPRRPQSSFCHSGSNLGCGDGELRIERPGTAHDLDCAQPCGSFKAAWVFVAVLHVFFLSWWSWSCPRGRARISSRRSSIRAILRGPSRESPPVLRRVARRRTPSAPVLSASVAWSCRPSGFVSLAYATASSESTTLPTCAAWTRRSWLCARSWHMMTPANIARRPPRHGTTSRWGAGPEGCEARATGVGIARGACGRVGAGTPTRGWGRAEVRALEPPSPGADMAGGWQRGLGDTPPDMWNRISIPPRLGASGQFGTGTPVTKSHLIYILPQLLELISYTLMAISYTHHCCFFHLTFFLRTSF